MKRFTLQLGRALAVAGMLSMLAATPALADRDDRGRHWKKHKHYSRHYDDRDRYWDRRRGYYHRDYDRYYWSGPRVSIYAPPVYVPPPPPPSFGLSLVFPIH